MKHLLSTLPLLAGLLGARAAVAQPRLHDRLWGISAPWITVPTNGLTELRIELSNITIDCTHPVAGRTESLCPGAGGQIDIIGHVFAPVLGEVATPIREQTAAGSHSMSLPSGITNVALFLHGGPSAAGIIDGKVDIYLNNFFVASQSFRFSDNVMLDLAPIRPTLWYDVVSVLVTDGPIRGANTTVGNPLNDHLGVDATEGWVLGPDFRVVFADLNFSGVGTAAHLADASIYYNGGYWAMVRPFTAPPSFPIVAYGNTFPVAPANLVPASSGLGRMRVIINDHYHNDADRDGVSDQVEAELLTCNGLNVFAGNRACITNAYRVAHPGHLWMDPRDTDGDGLSDRAEILGADVAMASVPDTNGLCGTSAPSQQIGVGQTFPRWGFDPRHKDSLVEIDMVPVRDSTPCNDMARTGSCLSGLGSQVIPQNSASPAPSVSFADQLLQLRRWHEDFDLLTRERTSNPDQRNGIELHFDVTTAPMPTANHGSRSVISLQDMNGVVRPGLLIAQPSAVQATTSTCACSANYACSAPQHGGYGRRALLNNVANGGGQSGTDRLITGSLLRGVAVAHEMGHHLGLAHGGPRNWGSNPFGFDEAKTPDLTDAHKVVHVSNMTYSYVEGAANPQGMRFSLGERSLSPLPRYEWDAGTASMLFGYPELASAGPAGVDPFRFFLGMNGVLSMIRPQGCTGLGCVDMDFDQNNLLAGIVALPLEDRGERIRGETTIIHVNGYFCPAEGVAALSNFCCGSPGRNADNTRCVSSGVTTDPTLVRTTNTMLMAGQPVSTIVGNRLINFFVDDLNPDPPEAGSAVNRQRCTQAPCPAHNFGKLRWTSLGQIVQPGDANAQTRNPFACSGRNTSCVDPSQITMGDVRTPSGALASLLSGQTQIAAATMTRANTEHVLLAWTSRTSMNCQGQAQCDSQWGDLNVTYASPDAAQPDPIAAGFRVVGLTGAALFGAQTAPRIAGVAAVAWNPQDNGEPTRTLLVVREAGGQFRTFWTLCDPDQGCNEMQQLFRDDGSPLQALSGLHFAVERPAVGATSALLAYALPNNFVTDTVGTLRVGRFQLNAGAPGFSVRQWVVQNSSGQTLQVAFDGSVSIATTHAIWGNPRVMLSAEAQFATNDFRIYSAVSGLMPFPMGSSVLNIGGSFSGGQWDYSRARLVGSGGSSTQPTFAPAPGFVRALIQDSRSGQVIGGSEMNRFDRRVRSFDVAFADSGVVYQFHTVNELAMIEPHYNRDEQATLAFNLCRTLATTSRGRPGYDLEQVPSGHGALRCPGATDWAWSNAGILSLAEQVRLYCLGDCLRGGQPDFRVYLDVAQLIVNPANWAAPVSAPATFPGSTRDDAEGGSACWAERESVRSFRVHEVAPP